jgi:hypothetical protein
MSAARFIWPTPGWKESRQDGNERGLNTLRGLRSIAHDGTGWCLQTIGLLCSERRGCGDESGNEEREARGSGEESEGRVLSPPLEVVQRPRSVRLMDRSHLRCETMRRNSVVMPFRTIVVIAALEDVSMFGSRPAFAGVFRCLSPEFAPELLEATH